MPSFRVRAGDWVRLAAVLTAASGYAQQYAFRHYGTAEGLQNMAALSLAQDGAGFLWAGTEGGLYRYDGTRFRLAGAAEGLPCAAEVQAMHTGADGALWVNTCSRLFRFNGQRFEEIPGVGEMLSRAQALADGSDSGIVAGTGSGLREVVRDGSGKGFAVRPYVAGSRFGAVKVRGVLKHGSQLWFGCNSRLCMEENGRLSEYGTGRGLPRDSWDGIGVTPDGAVWVRSPSRLYVKAAGSTRFSPEPAGIAPSMFWGALTVTGEGTVLVPTDKGLAIRRHGAWSVIDESRGLRSPMVTAALVDRGGSLWIAMAGAGIARCLGCGQWESWTKAQGLPSNLVWNIRRDRKGSVWVATSMGLTRLPGKLPQRTWTVRDGLGGENVRWLGETPDGAIWAIAKPGGLARLDPASGTVRRAGPTDGLQCQTAHRGLVDHAGRLWVASSDGVFRTEAPAGSGRFVRVNPDGVMEKGAWALAEDRQGIVWAVGPDGLWRLGQGTWRHYGKADGLLSDNPYIIAVAADNSLWLRHRYDAGVERVEFDRDRLIRSTAVVAADPAGVDVTAFHEFDSRGGFWRGTASGVAVLRNEVWTRLGAEDGLVWDDCDGEAFWADSDGSVWIGTSGGLSHFHPGPAAQAAVADPIISSLEIRDHPRLVRASFSSLAYRYEQTVRFEYRLDHGPWTPAQERSIAMPEMRPGRHFLEVRSRVRDGPYSGKPARADFYVDPQWWEAWWFLGLAALSTAGATAGGVIWRQRLLQGRNQALEGVVRQRTAELEAERARADAASRAKGQFLANMSHEIRTPLNGLLGLARLLEDARDADESRELIRLLRSSGETLLRIINDILDFSKVEAGKLELETVSFPLRSTLEEVAALFRGAALQKGLKLECDLAPGLPDWVSGDPVRLRQVVQNLISNGVKFTNSGYIRLSASVESRTEETHVIRMEVRDTGIGIAPDQIGNLFTSFSQADASISRRYGGTGLGLAICKRLVELMGGRIAVESEPGVGTVFGLTIAFGTARSPSASNAAENRKANPRGVRVLLAEDNKVNQVVGLKLLQKLGVTADLADDGAQAVAAVMQNSYDLVLMDVQMPSMDGLAATREIRERLAGGRRPLICGLSAQASGDFRDYCLRTGMDRYLTKPIEAGQLSALLAELDKNP